MKIPRPEVLRYLGYKNQPISAELDRLIDDCMVRSEEIASPKTVYAEFEVHPGGANAPVRLAGASLELPGENIREYLEDCPKVVLLAATLGIEADREIRRWQHRDMTRCLILDACFTAAIEAVCDEVQEEIRQIARAQGFGIKYRYGPGYGDLPLNIQQKFLAVLDAGRKIGLTALESSMLMPSKSVTALIGFADQDQPEAPDPCAGCAAAGSCRYKKEGVFCGRNISQKT